MHLMATSRPASVSRLHRSAVSSERWGGPWSGAGEGGSSGGGGVMLSHAPAEDVPEGPAADALQPDVPLRAPGRRGRRPRRGGGGGHGGGGRAQVRGAGAGGEPAPGGTTERVNQPRTPGFIGLPGFSCRGPIQVSPTTVPCAYLPGDVLTGSARSTG